MLQRYGYIWVTLVLFLASFIAQYATHDGTMTEFVNAVMENWQSEFLQLIWQVLGLSILLCVGSPQSKDNDEVQNQKLDNILAITEDIKHEVFANSPVARYRSLR